MPLARAFHRHVGPLKLRRFGPTDLVHGAFGAEARGAFWPRGRRVRGLTDLALAVRARSAPARRACEGGALFDSVRTTATFANG